MKLKKLLTGVIFAIFVVAFSLNLTHAQTTTDSAQTLKDRLLERKEDFRETIQMRRLNIKDTILQKREELRSLMQTKREEFRKSLSEIRDARKKEIVERINNRINTINENWTNRMLEILEKLESLLARITEKENILEAEGKDTTALEAAIDTADKALDATTTAVENQAAKEYVVEIGDETTLKNTVGSTVSQFRQDLRDVHKSIIDAKQAVSKAASELAQIKRAGKKDSAATEAATTQ